MARPLDIVARFRTVTTEFNTRQVERELDDADRAFEKSERDAQDWARSLKRSADKAGDGVRNADIGESGKEVGQEFAQNIGEGIGSGEVNIQDALLGTIGGLVNVPVVGPAALIAGTLIAAIVGNLQKRQEQMRQAGNSLYGAFTDGILEAAESEQAIADLLGVDSFADAVPVIAKQAAALKVPVEDLLAYYKSFGRTSTPAIKSSFAKVDNAVAAGARGVGTTVSGEFRRTVEEVRGFVSDIDGLSAQAKRNAQANITADDLIRQEVLDAAEARTKAYTDQTRRYWDQATGAAKAYRAEVEKPYRLPRAGTPGGKPLPREP